MRTRILKAALAAATAVALAACGNSTPTHSAMDLSGSAGTHSGMAMPSGSSHDRMDMTSDDGLAGAVNGYALHVALSIAGNKPPPITFTIVKDGKTVTQFDPEQTKLMHFYLIRSDLSGFQHLHPTMATDGTWSVTPAALQPGMHRLYVQFLPHGATIGGAVVLAQQVEASGAGAARSAQLPAPSTTATADGYTITVAGTPKAGTDVPLKLNITHSGTPVRDLQPYLDTYAHVTAIHEGDLAFAHLHPSGTVKGDHGGPALTVNADLPEPGSYRMFIQFQTRGQVHTAPLTITAT